MNKIIGFLIARDLEPDLLQKVDVFGANLTVLIEQCGKYYLHLWGMGDLKQCKVKGAYSLSFPLHANLLDRNVLIYAEEGKCVVENDWLGAIPVFYNTAHQRVSTLLPLCVVGKDIHPEGLTNFCRYGYSVFEQTLYHEVRFLRYFSCLQLSGGQLDVSVKSDPVLADDFLMPTDPGQAIKALSEYMLYECQSKGDIILPMSGGYDSRLLMHLVQDKKRIRSFTYGISMNQSHSIEVVYARYLSKYYQTRWQQIELQGYHQYIDEWFSLYGCSTHLHGMYHIEFYKKIVAKQAFTHATLLSGIVGDAWAGGLSFKPIKSSQDIIALGLSHNMSVDEAWLRDMPECALQNAFFEQHKQYLNIHLVQVVFTIRMKMMLLSYLTQLPEYFGFPVWTPFLSFDVVRTMLNIPDEKWRKRQWQVQFFKEHNLNLEDKVLRGTKSNMLDYQASKQAILSPVYLQQLSAHFHLDCLHSMSSMLKQETCLQRWKNRLMLVPKIGGILRRLGFSNTYLKALYAYYVLKSVEKGL